jgi:hypothetical protein
MMLTVRLTTGMTIRWDFFVNQYDSSRYSADARDSRHIQFVREFASVVSVLQVHCALQSWSIYFR